MGLLEGLNWSYWISRISQSYHLYGMGLKRRVPETGDVVDGCTGTGALETEQDYIVREALSGYDDRTGSLALWFAVEMMQSVNNLI